MSQQIKIAAAHDIELHIKFESGRGSAFLEVQQYLEKEAMTAFMAFNAQGDARAFELRSLAAMVGRWGEATSRAIEQTRALTAGVEGDNSEA